MELKVRSIQIIKPSNPTPENRRDFKLSLLDQLAPSYNIPIIFYYKASSDVINMTNRYSQLVKSLLEALTLFYPLAGRITEDGLEVDCCDQGIKYLETQVSMRLDDFLEQGPRIDFISELIGTPDTTLVNVQVNVFNCGSLAIGRFYLPYSMKMKIRSIQIIKPSKPTPENRRTFKLSLFDQLATSANINIIFYYKSNGEEVNMLDRCSQLVKSLSEVLTLFYPLAGRVAEDGLEVDCCDQGVKFLETQVSMRLDDFLEQGHKIDHFSQLLGAPDQVTTTLVTVQVNVFDCGALVIGVSASHKVTDACNLIRFVNEWASINRAGGSHGAFSPSFDNLDDLFPPMKISPSSDQSPNLNDPEAKIIPKRFLFNGDNISKLRAKASSSPNHRHSRVTLVTAIIWKAIISIDQVKSGSLRNCLLAPAMNLRGKAGSPVSESSFGNVWAPYPIRFSQNEMESKFVDLVTLIDGTRRNAIIEIQKASGKEICTQTLACIAETAEELKQNKFSLFTSWCSFPIYKADFGWGKPYWASPVVGISIQMVVLMDDEHGDGIEAWICLEEKDMYLFEQDQDIITFTS